MVAHPEALDAEVDDAVAQSLGADARVLLELLQAVAHLVEPAVAFGIRPAHALDRHQQVVEVVVVEDADLGDLLEALGAHVADPGVGADDAHPVAEEAAHAADALGAVVVEVVLVADLGHHRHRQVLGQLVGAQVGPGRRTLATVRARERLVQVEVAGVEAGVARPGEPQDAVGVGLVGEGQGAGVVQDLDVLVDLRVVDAGVLGVGDHAAHGLLGHGRLEGLEVRVAVLVGHHGDDLEAGHHRRGGVAGVREDRRDHLAALVELALGLEVAAHDARVGEHRVRAAAGLQREGVHAADRLQVLAGVVDDLEQALHRLLVLPRVHVGGLVPADQLLVHLGAVLHRAGALADVAAEVHAERHLRVAQVVAQHLVLRHLGQLGGGRAAHPRGDVARGLTHSRGHVVFGERHEDAALAGRALLHDERLVPARGLVVAQHAAVAAQLGQTGDLLVRRLAHAVTSLTAAAKVSMSAWS